MGTTTPKTTTKNWKISKTLKTKSSVHCKRVKTTTIKLTVRNKVKLKSQPKTKIRARIRNKKRQQAMMMTMRTMRIKTRRRMTSQNSWQDRITQNSHSKMMMMRITRMTRRSLIRHKLCKVPISVRQTTMMMISSRCRCRWMVKILSSSAKMDKAKMARNFSRRRECLISQSRCLTWSPSVYTRWT